MNAAALTQLGAALGCDLKVTDSEERIDGLPARCYYTGPFLAASPRAPKVELEALTHMDREARELAARGRADIIRFCQMMRRARGGK